MSNLVVANSGERWLLDTTLKTALLVDQVWRVHGFVNDYEPLGAVVLADLTDCTLPGYAPVGLTRSVWQASATVNGQAVANYAGNPVQLTCTSGMANVFGFYVTDPSDTVLLWVKRFDDAPRVLDPLHPVQCLLKLAGRSQSEPV